LYYNVWMTLLLRHVRLAAEKNGAPADILLSGGKISAIGDLPPRADFIFEGEGALRVPTWPARIAVILGAALAALEYLLAAAAHARALVTGETLPGDVASPGTHGL